MLYATPHEKVSLGCQIGLIDLSCLSHPNLVSRGRIERNIIVKVSDRRFLPSVGARRTTSAASRRVGRRSIMCNITGSTSSVRPLTPNQSRPFIKPTINEHSSEQWMSMLVNVSNKGRQDLSRMRARLESPSGTGHSASTRLRCSRVVKPEQT